MTSPLMTETLGLIFIVMLLLDWQPWCTQVLINVFTSVPCTSRSEVDLKVLNIISIPDKQRQHFPRKSCLWVTRRQVLRGKCCHYLFTTRVHECARVCKFQGVLKKKIPYTMSLFGIKGSQTPPPPTLLPNIVRMIKFVSRSHEENLFISPIHTVTTPSAVVLSCNILQSS